MNITDIDDKIIKRARQNYLYDEYVKSVKSLEQLLSDQKEVFGAFNATITKNTDPDKKVMLDRMLERMTTAVDGLTKAVESKQTAEIEKAQNNYLSEAKDAISDWLDRKRGATVNENSIFESLPRYWEDEFHKDMSALNVSKVERFIVFRILHQWVKIQLPHWVLLMFPPSSTLILWKLMGFPPHNCCRRATNRLHHLRFVSVYVDNLI